VDDRFADGRSLDDRFADNRSVDDRFVVDMFRSGALAAENRGVERG
jgi:hypothetical protein